MNGEKKGPRSGRFFLSSENKRKEARATESGSRSGVGQTSGLPVRGASGSVLRVRSKHRAGGPANRQTRGLPYSPSARHRQVAGLLNSY